MKKENRKEKLSTGATLKKFLGAGWYRGESQGGIHWAWSKKNAFLNLPGGGPFFIILQTGLAQYLGREIEVQVIDESSGLIRTEKIGGNPRRVNIPAGCRKIQLNISETIRPAEVVPGSRDKRRLGVCLLDVIPAGVYVPRCSARPLFFEIETTTRCNINPPCVMCHRTVNSRASEKSMSDRVLARLRPALTGARFASLHGEGEPLENDRIFDLLAAIDTRKTRTKFNTNGLLLDRQKAEKLIDLLVTEISVSLDAATSETYKNIRGQDFNLVLENIRQFLALKKSRGVKYPLLTMNITLMKANIEEAAAFVELAAELGVSQLYFQLLTPSPEDWKTVRGDFVFEYSGQFLDLADPRFVQNMRMAMAAGFKNKVKVILLDIELKDE